MRPIRALGAAVCLGWVQPPAIAGDTAPTLIWAESQAPATLHPLYAVSARDRRALAPTYPPLARPHGADWHHPILTDVHWTAGQVQVEVRPGTRFHDGRKVTATHLCETVAALKRSHSELGARVGPLLRGCSPDPKHPRRATLELSVASDNPLWGALAFPLLPTHLQGDIAQPDHPLAHEPNGTGPWRAEPHDGGIHYAPLVGDTALAMRVLPQPEETASLLRAGTIHGWPDVPADWVAPLRDAPRVRLHTYPMRLLLGVALNVEALPDPTDRSALQPDPATLCADSGSLPTDAPPLCRPAMGPFHLDHPGLNHAIRPTVGGPVPERLRVFIPTDLDWPAEQIRSALQQSWPDTTLDTDLQPTHVWLSQDPTQVPMHWDAVVVARFAGTDPIATWLGPQGPLNPFRVAPQTVRSALREGQTPELHAAHADAITHLWWVQRDGVSAWSAELTTLWMTTPDGLGAVDRWDLTPIGAPP